MIAEVLPIAPSAVQLVQEFTHALRRLAPELANLRIHHAVIDL
jgi:hypothetical protein